MNEDMTFNLQADSFKYIHMLLEALDRLGCLEVAVDRIEQRLPVELFSIVDRTNQEVDLRHPAHLHDTARLETLEHGPLHSKGRSGVLDDLLWTLYSRFEAVAEGHRVLHDVVSGIARRNGLRRPSNLTRSFKELWKLYQSEVSDATACGRSSAKLCSCDLCCMITLQPMKVLRARPAILRQVILVYCTASDEID